MIANTSALDHVTIDTRSLLARTGLVAAAVLVFVFALATLCWSFGGAIATNANDLETAEFSVWLAPDDPQTHFALAKLAEATFEPGQLDRAVHEYEKAAARSPHNYLIWLELAQAYENSGDTERAGLAYDRVLYLAPNYSSAKWAVGNYRVRQGEVEIGFELIRQAVNAYDSYTDPAVTLAFDIFAGDIAQVRSALGTEPEFDAALIKLLLKREKIDEAFALFRSNSQMVDGDLAKTLSASLIEAGRYRDAVQIEPGKQVGAIDNGGFEQPIMLEGGHLFNWRLGSQGAPEIAIGEGRAREGSRSLLLAFRNARLEQGFRPISQTVAVIPGQAYRFEADYQAEIEGSASVKWTVTTAAGVPIAETDAAQPTAAWRTLRADFVVPTGTDGIVVSTAPAKCTSVTCRLNGNIWFDEVRLIER